ncbi:MAG: tRNA pseudouridine(38-40) synthase TruA [Deltaproteobacteria bacterium]|nr:tRNA pseudouridine(38-40) synthase TruA [Deltaproteobacteria bacterium]
MPNVKLILEYDGSRFHGWQWQPGLRTIQGELERVLRTVLRADSIAVKASGRTDAGVHARAQVVNFFVEELPDLHRLTHSVSSLLKGEVSVLSADIVPDTFDARRSAVAKQYSYSILARKAPAVLQKGRVWHISAPLSIEAMEAEAALLIGEHDFSSFRDAACANRSPVKTIFKSAFSRKGDLLIYSIAGSGFLKQMVRNIVGTLVAFGRGGAQHSSILDIMRLKDRRVAGVTAPAHGLCLDWVCYSKEELSKRIE